MDPSPSVPPVPAVPPVRERVAAAIGAVPRDYLPADQQAAADEDVPLRIGHGATSSQPSTVAAMLELLDAQPGHRVLDVGAGSGWTTALLGHLVGPSGRVVGVELVPALVASASARLTAAGMRWATIEVPAPGVLGQVEHAPYDRILVSAMAGELPHTLCDQLADGGGWWSRCRAGCWSSSARVTGSGSGRLPATTGSCRCAEAAGGGPGCRGAAPGRA